MTPLEIGILLHYHCTVTDFRDGDFGAPAVREAIDRFVNVACLLSPTAGDPESSAAYRLTERGHVYVKALQAVPLPMQRWVMPGVRREGEG